MPTIEDVLPKLTRAKIFSVLDAKKNFCKIELNDTLSFLTTFWIPFGCYRWLRIPFGISSAPGEFQRRQNKLLGDLEAVDVIADDILVYGCGDSDEEALRDHNFILSCTFTLCLSYACFNV